MIEKKINNETDGIEETKRGFWFYFLTGVLALLLAVLTIFVINL